MVSRPCLPGLVALEKSTVADSLSLPSFPLVPRYSASADEDRLEKLISELSGKDINEVIAEGSKKLASVPSGGAGPAAAAGGASAGAAVEEKKEEKVEEKEESDDDMGCVPLSPRPCTPSRDREDEALTGLLSLLPPYSRLLVTPPPSTRRPHPDASFDPSLNPPRARTPRLDSASASPSTPRRPSRPLLRVSALARDSTSSFAQLRSLRRSFNTSSKSAKSPWRRADLVVLAARSKRVTSPCVCRTALLCVCNFAQSTCSRVGRRGYRSERERERAP